MKQIKGVALNINGHIIGKVALKNRIFKSNEFLVCEKIPKYLNGVKALIMPVKPEAKLNIPIFVSDDINLLNDGDIVSILPDGFCNVLWEITSPHNALYLTDVCNSKCIMCPQPMTSSSRNYYQDNAELIDLIDFKKTEIIGITGGEPTLNIDKFSEILNLIRKKSKHIPIHVLTNGRQFENIENLNKVLSVRSGGITYGIPLYSSIAEEHDYIVGADGAFNQTINALYNLAKNKQMIEIRIVVLRQNYSILKNIVDFIYRNMPFVTNVAIMSAEYTGLAETNYNEVFVDPIEYKTELYEAIKQLHRYNIKTAVYNTPLCLLDKRIWDFSADSISTWKKTYTNKCIDCSVKDRCGGVFATSFTHSENIFAIS